MNASEGRRPFRIQDRDIAILRGLFESRTMTLRHVTDLFFNGKHEAAKKRIQKLKCAGLIGERQRRLYDPSILFFTQRAFMLLSKKSGLSDYPDLSWGKLEGRASVSEQTLRHELEVMDVKAAIVIALKKRSNFQIAEFGTWPKLYEFEVSTRSNACVLVKPDGFIRIQERRADGVANHAFFLEVDRSTEAEDRLIAHALCYHDYYKNGGFAVRNGRPASEYKLFPFRVLMVFKSTERRNNAAMRMLLNNPPISSQVWMTTLDEIRNDPLKPIWVRPVDFRGVLRGANIERHSFEHLYDSRRPVPDPQGMKHCLIAA